ncbi:hypothetical protein M1P56_22380 [Streptomyces sp. HU2014]|uniref:ATP-grasp domain-containing protein n=1 Tax=Streptomyces albireticuli TaxID=1940 RepID=A0A1Z2KXB0_9ACTN|nr:MULTISPECIES: hypothetical protein [Streptomyces]ARZ66669.1 hypothetical protein SMD11_1004 [Streptomyces albireticuli]UQI46900.1 hypothetical protein M1P56_22380 [Streptomyces sp. HU2014]
MRQSANGPRAGDAGTATGAGTGTEERITGTVTRVLRNFWSGRGAVLLLDDFDHRATSLVDELRACGARVGAVIARTGPAAGAPEVDRSLHCSDAGLDFTRPEFEAWLRDPSEDVRAWLDGLDPAREWVVLGTPRTGVDRFCGRPVHGWRRPEWAAVEDKTTIDALWAAAGVAAPPHVVVTVDELLRGPAGLDGVAGPAGVVVAADSTRGHVGDSLGLRWVPGLAGFPDAVREFAGRAHRVRIARFADGVPCSVLCMALPDGVAVFSPIEIVTLGDPETGRLLFCGSSTHWRPGDAAERDIRGAARRAGAELVRTTGYRGIFSVDGLLTPDGFTATELNPRHASGLGLRAALPDFPVYLYNRAVQEGLPGLEGITAAALEGLVRRLVAAAPSTSLAVGTTPVEAVPPAPDHRAGPACADLAARLGEPGLRAFPLAEAPARPGRPAPSTGLSRSTR